MHINGLMRTSLLLGLLAFGLGAITGCRFAKKSDAEELDRSVDATEGGGAVTATNRNLRQIGSPRVSLLNTPCGSAAQIEPFMARVNNLGLANQFLKLPASEWKFRDPSGAEVNLCKFLQQRTLEVGFFVLISEGCSKCIEQFVTLAEAVGSLSERSSGAARLALVGVIAGVVSEATRLTLSGHVDATNGLSTLVTDPEQSLWVKLSEKSQAGNEFPVFLVHESGYGMFSNKAQTQRESIARDFLKLYEAL